MGRNQGRTGGAEREEGGRWPWRLLLSTVWIKTNDVLLLSNQAEKHRVRPCLLLPVLPDAPSSSETLTHTPPPTDALAVIIPLTVDRGRGGVVEVS